MGTTIKCGHGDYSEELLAAREPHLREDRSDLKWLLKQEQQELQHLQPRFETWLSS